METLRALSLMFLMFFAQPHLVGFTPQGARTGEKKTAPFGGFHKWGYPKCLFYRENHTKMDDLGVPLFQETTIYRQ